MSRAINLSLPEAEVRVQCTAAGVSISAIEPLLSGGTHLVCQTGEGAEEIRLRFRDQIIEGAVRRIPFYRVGSTP
jgi:hypothetical protein